MSPHAYTEDQLARISHSVIKQNLWNRRKESVHKAFERQNTEVLR